MYTDSTQCTQCHRKKIGINACQFDWISAGLILYFEPQWTTAENGGFIVELIAQVFEFLEVDCFTLSNLCTSIIYHQWQPLCYLSNGHCFRTTQFQTAHWIQYTHDSTHSFSVIVQKLGSFLANWFTYLQVSSCILWAEPQLNLRALL
jgi:hypothetical protein